MSPSVDNDPIQMMNFPKGGETKEEGRASDQVCVLLCNTSVKSTKFLRIVYLYKTTFLFLFLFIFISLSYSSCYGLFVCLTLCGFAIVLPKTQYRSNNKKGEGFEGVKTTTYNSPGPSPRSGTTPGFRYPPTHRLSIFL